MSRGDWSRRFWRLVDVAIVPVATLAVAPAAWWVWTPVLGRPHGTDRMFTPPDWLVATEHAVGASAVLVGAAGIRAFDALASTGSRRARWAAVLRPLALALAYVGATYRVAITPVSGANIGGALMVLGIAPVTIVCAGLSIAALFDVGWPEVQNHGRRPES